MKSCLYIFIACQFFGGIAQVAAEELAGQYSSLPYPSVADNIAAMDKDHDGIVTVHEMRVFIESRHGQGFEKKVFDDMEKSAENRSCGSSFSKSLY